MVPKNWWKHHHGVGLQPELLDVETDSEELVDLANNSCFMGRLDAMEALRKRTYDPDAVDAKAKRDQHAMIEPPNGLEVAAAAGGGLRHAGARYVTAISTLREVERLFRRLKGYGRIFSRFEKSDVMFLGFNSPLL